MLYKLPKIFGLFVQAVYGTWIHDDSWQNGCFIVEYVDLLPVVEWAIRKNKSSHLSI